ncbi:MAG: OsmC family protein, partial [Promethearchaeota archaeon]
MDKQKMDLQLLIKNIRKNPEISKSILTVKLKKESPKKIHAKIRKHKFIFDKPKALGGMDVGPTSAEMLLASTGACMISVLEVWANILEIDIKNIEANIFGTIDHRGRLGISEDVFPGLQNINIDFKIDT